MLKRNEKNLGVLLMVTACAFFCTMACLVKLVSHIDPVKIGLSRFVVGICILTAATIMGTVKLRFNNKRLLFVRGLLGGIGIILTYLSIIKLGISKGMVLVATYPVFAYIFSVIIIRERPSVASAAAVVTAFVGIYLVMTGNKDTAGLWSGFGVYEVLAVSVGLIGGLVIVTIRKLHQTDSSYSIYFSQCAIGFCLAAGPSRFWAASVKPQELILLLSIGVLATIGQLMMTQSYKHLPVRKGAVLGMLEPLFCYVAGVIIFGELFNITTAFGSLLIIGSCAAVVLLDNRVKTAKAEPGKAQVCKS